MPSLLTFIKLYPEMLTTGVKDLQPFPGAENIKNLQTFQILFT